MNKLLKIVGVLVLIALIVWGLNSAGVINIGGDKETTPSGKQIGSTATVSAYILAEGETAGQKEVD